MRLAVSFSPKREHCISASYGANFISVVRNAVNVFSLKGELRTLMPCFVGMFIKQIVAVLDRRLPWVKVFEWAEKRRICREVAH